MLGARFLKVEKAAVSKEVSDNKQNNSNEKRQNNANRSGAMGLALEVGIEV